MAALNKREIEMIFRADADKATRPIGELSKATRTLTGNLSDQIKVADRGEASLDSLAATTRDLKAAQDELGTARSLLTQLNAQEAALAKAEIRAAETAEKYAMLKTQVEAAEAPTKRLTNSMEAAERNSKTAADQLARVAAETEETRQRITAIIGPVDNFQKAFHEIADTSKEISRGLAVAGNAAEDFKRKMAAANAVDTKLNADVSFEQQGRSAGLLQSQIDYISQFENRVELLAQARRELSAQDAQFQKSLLAQEAKVGAQNVRDIARAFDEAAEAEARLQRVAGFQDIAAKAVAAANDTTRYGVAATTATAAVTRLGDAVIRITNPMQAAADTLETVEKGIESAEAALNNTNKLRISVYQDALNEVSRSVAGLQRQAAQVDGLRTQQAAVDAAERSFEEARVKVIALAQALGSADEPTEEMARALRQAEAAAEQAGTALGNERTRLVALGEAAQKAGIDIKNLDAAEAKIVGTANRAAKASDGLAGKLGTKGGGFLGLKPYELQNLGYQINDVFTSLASGAPPMQVIAQQGGQIAQLFPGLFARMAAYAVPLLALAAGITAVAVALGRTADDAKRLRGYEGTISALGETNGLDAAKLENATKKLRDFGVATKDAEKVVLSFAKQGVAPAIFDDFTAAAANASKVMRVDVATAADAMAKGFTGGKKEVLALQEQFPFLTDAEYKHIKSMNDSTDSNEIRRIAFDAFYKKMAEGAADMEGPWSEATRTLSTAWNGMLDTLAETGVVDTIIQTISRAVQGMAVLINLAQEFNKQQQTNNSPWSPGAPRTLKTWKDALLGTDKPQDNRSFGELYDAALLKTRDQTLASDAAGRKRTGAGLDPGAGTAGDRRERGEQAEAARKKAEQEAKKRAREAAAARRKAENEAEALRKRILAQSEQLDNSLDRMTTTALRRSTGNLTTLLQNATKSVEKEFAPLQRELDEFSQRTGGKGLIGGKTIADYQAALDANKTTLNQTRQLAIYEQNVNDLVDQRGRELKAIEEDRASSYITGAEASERSLEVTSRINKEISEAAASAALFASSIGGAADSPELQALIAKLDAIQKTTGEGARNTLNREAGAKFVAADESALNKIIAERNNLITAQNMLVEVGLQTNKGAEAVREAAYVKSKKLIDEQIAAMRATLDVQRQSGAMNQMVYDAWIAKLQAVSAQSVYVNTNVQQMTDLVNGQLVEGGTALFSSLSSGIAGLLTGTQSLGEAFNGLLNTFLGFAAQFLQKIAEMIIQQLIFNAVQAAGGGPGGGGGGIASFFSALVKHDGGTVGDYGRGNRRRDLSITPAMLASAPRYHDGTPGAGLARNEQLAVLERGEKVLTEEQQRREAAAGGAAGPINLRPVLAFGDDEIAGAMSGPAGEKTTLFHIRRNKTMLKQMLKD